MTTVPAPRRSRSLSPFELRLERRLDVPRWLPLAATLGAVAVALVIGGVIIALVGGDPIRAYVHILRAAFGTVGVLSDTLVKATPLIFTGLACALAFRMRLWNIGAEGQLLMGAWGASAVVLLPVLPDDAPAILFVALMALASMAAGALWGFIPGCAQGALRGQRDHRHPDAQLHRLPVDRVLGLRALERGRLPAHPPVPEGRLAAAPDRLRARHSRASRGLTVHLGLVFALIAAAVVWFILKRSRWGYEIRLIGDNASAARYAGIDIARNIDPGASWSLARWRGWPACPRSAAWSTACRTGFSPGYGFTGIIMAYLARFNPFGVVVASIAFGALILAGREIQPAGVPAMIQGIVLFCLIGSDVLLRYTVRFVRRRAPELDATTILSAGVAAGTIYLFAAVGEIFAERAGILNLGVEGMMLIGAVAGFRDGRGDRQPVAGARWWRCSPAGC